MTSAPASSIIVAVVSVVIMSFCSYFWFLVSFPSGVVVFGFFRVLWLVVGAFLLPCCRFSVVVVWSRWYCFVVVVRCLASFLFLAVGSCEFVLSVGRLVAIVWSLYGSTRRLSPSLEL